MKNNICIICRDKDLARGVAEELSKKLGIHYADTMGIVEYKLSDFFAVAESLEPGYLDRLVLKEIEEISTYSECCYYVTYEFIDQLLVSKKIVANSVLVLLCPTRKNCHNHLSYCEALCGRACATEY